MSIKTGSISMADMKARYASGSVTITNTVPYQDPVCDPNLEHGDNKTPAKPFMDLTYAQSIWQEISLSHKPGKAKKSRRDHCLKLRKFWMRVL